MANSNIIIGSRGSKLALWQAEWVKSRLENLHEDIEVSIQVIKTEGDRNQTSSLSAIGGQGVFTKEIEDALLARRIDLAVHSLKDLPTTTPDGLTIAAITEREDPRDALVLPAENGGGGEVSLSSLPPGARVGTSSPRRIAQLKGLRQELICLELRGNVDTRLRKLDSGDYDAIILACAGLSRLGSGARISYRISPDEMIPAVGQGALGLEVRTEDSELLFVLKGLDHSETRHACLAERAMLKALGGGCQLPIAGHAKVKGEVLFLDGLVASPSGDRIVRDLISGPVTKATELGNELGARLLENGARQILAQA